MDQVRSDRPRDLIMKREAPVIRAERLEPADQTRRMRLNVEAIEHPDRWALITATKLAAKRGEIRILSEVPVFQGGVYRVKVIRLKNPPPRWRRTLLITLAVLLPVGALLGLIAWTILSLSSVALSSMLGTVLLLLLLGLLIGRTGGGGSKSITVNIRQ